MKKNNNLVTVLYVLSRLSFQVCLLFLLLFIVFECIPNGAIGNVTPNIHHSKGYLIKTQVQLNAPDTVIYFKNKLRNSSGIVSKTGIDKFDDNFNKVKKDNQLEKRYQINTLDIYGGKPTDIKNEFDNIKIQDNTSEMDVTVNPKNYLFKVILVLKNYLSIALLLFITYQLMSFFKQIKVDFAFNKLLTRRIQYIGYSLILYQVANTIASIIVTQYLPTIHYQRHSSSITNSTFEFITLHTIVEYDLKSLFLALCLIVLSKLLSYGYDLQNENDLTI